MRKKITDYEMKHQKREWRKAWKALKVLIREHESTDQVFLITKALAGNSPYKQYQRFAATKNGKRILRERLNIIDRLQDHDYLQSLPEKSLGRAYLDFVKSENLSAEALVKAHDPHQMDVENKDLRLYLDRTRDVHDLWHVLSGYGRNPLGEGCVVAFSYAHTKNMGFAVIALMVCFEFSKKLPDQSVWGAVWQAYRNGCKAKWLMGEVFEDLLPMNLGDVRKMLNIAEPDKYRDSGQILKECFA